MENTKIGKTNLNIKINEIVYDELKITAKKLGISKDAAIEQAFKDFNERKPMESKR